MIYSNNNINKNSDHNYENKNKNDILLSLMITSIWLESSIRSRNI